MNEHALRLDEKLEGWSRAAISRRLAQRVFDGANLMSAVVGVSEELQMAPKHVISIEKVGEVNQRGVSISGEVVTLWTPSHPRIAQVGLLEDETGTITFTA